MEVPSGESFMSGLEREESFPAKLQEKKRLPDRSRLTHIKDNGVTRPDSSRYGSATIMDPAQLR